MSFYGTNLSASNRVPFQFDRIFANRVAMDATANTDGIDQGRFVLVEYGEPPIMGYFNVRDNKFYNSPDYSSVSLMAGQVGRIYKNITSTRFYIYRSEYGYWTATTDRTSDPYIVNSTKDVAAYGRNYDSTVWMKYLTVEEGVTKAKYLLIGELNILTPEFHMVVDPPETLVAAPYLDRETTNMDYYLHIQAHWADKLRYESEHSDFTAPQRDITWSPAANTQRPVNQTFYVSPEADKELDIYFNKAGLNKARRSYVTGVNDGIGFVMTKSGRVYYDTVNSQGVFANGTTAYDTREWYVRLPSIGNTMCEVHDLTYGYLPSGVRQTKLATRRGDPDPLVSYKSNSLIGLINRFKDAVGHNLVEKTNNIANTTYNKSDTTTLYYTPGDGANQNPDMPQKFYGYVYDPDYAAGTLNADKSLTLNEASSHTISDVDFYYYDTTEHIYKVANPASYPTGSTLYRAIDKWSLKELQTPFEDSLYGAILNVTQTVGREHTLRDNSFYGIRNRMLDLIKSIQGNLSIGGVDYGFSPNRLMATNNAGTVVASDAVFPQQGANREYIFLNGIGNWSTIANAIFGQQIALSTATINSIKANVKNEGRILKFANSDVYDEDHPNVELIFIKPYSSAANSTTYNILNGLVEYTFENRQAIQLTMSEISTAISDLQQSFYQSYYSTWELESILVTQLGIVTPQQWQAAVQAVRGYY